MPQLPNQRASKSRRVKSTLLVSPALFRLIQNLQYHHLQTTGETISLQALLVQALIAYAKRKRVAIPKGVEE